MTKREIAVRSAELFLQQGRRSALLLGPRCRTWYSDEAKLYEIMLFLEHFGTELWIADVLPFDATVESVASYMGAALQHAGSTVLEERLRNPVRPEGLLGLVDLVVAFPARGSKELSSADPLVERALGSNLPILGVWVTDDITWTTSSNQHYA